MKVVSFPEWMVMMGMLGPATQEENLGLLKLLCDLGPGDTEGKFGTSETAVLWPFETNAEGKRLMTK